MCKLCETKPVYEFTNQRKLCKNCFIQWFQKKVLYTIRKFEMISKHHGRTLPHFVPSARTRQQAPNTLKGTRDFNKKSLLRAMIVGYENKGNFRDVVLEDVLKMFAEKAIVELVKLPSKIKLDKIAIASTTDLEADKIIHALINGGKKLTSQKEGKIIKPLYLFLDKEVLLYAKLRNLKFKKVKESGTQGCTPNNIQKSIVTRGNKISKFIDELEKIHPEVKQAVVSSWLGK